MASGVNAVCKKGGKVLRPVELAELGDEAVAAEARERGNVGWALPRRSVHPNLSALRLPMRMPASSRARSWV